MNKGLKILFLGVILILPVLIYLFLQAFGENKFDLSVFPQEAVSIDGCGSFAANYRVSALSCGSGQGSRFSLPDGHRLLHFPGPKRAEESNEIRRFLQKSGTESYTLITFAGELESDHWKSVSAGEKSWSVVNFCNEGVRQILECQLLISLADFKYTEQEGSLVLVDAIGQIRGFYLPFDKEDIDRLIIEVDILTQAENN